MNVVGENLKRIRLLKSLSLKEAGLLLNMSAPAISKYEKGEIKPDSQKLIEFADAYNVKVLDLLRCHNKVEMKFDAFRKRQRLQGEKLKLLKETIQNKVADYIEVVKLNAIKGSNNKIKKYVCNSDIDAEVAAEEFRKKYKLSINQPIPDLINMLENIGILIIEIDNVNEKFTLFDGLSEVVNDIPIIILLKNIDGERQRFTIAHELGHLVLNINNNLNEEKMCNKFASSLLMPKEAVIKEFGESRSNISFYELIAFKSEYKVSMAATIYRLKELSIISEYLFKKINIFLSSKGYKKHEPYPVESEKSYQFKRLVHKLEVNKIISLNRACELLEISVDDYNNEDNNYRY